MVRDFFTITFFKVVDTFDRDEVLVLKVFCVVLYHVGIQINVHCNRRLGGLDLNWNQGDCLLIVTLNVMLLVNDLLLLMLVRNDVNKNWILLMKLIVYIYWNNSRLEKLLLFLVNYLMWLMLSSIIFLV